MQRDASPRRPAGIARPVPVLLLGLVAPLLIGFLFAAGLAAAAGTTLYVGTALDGTPDGSCAHPGYTSIQAAISAASADDVVHLCAGTYTVASELWENGHAITLEGDGSANTILEGTGGIRIVSNAVGLVVRDLTFRNGRATAGGGGAVRTAAISATRVVFEGNRSAATGSGGGAIYATSGSITDCRFSGNVNLVGYGGGAIYVSNTGLTLTVTSSLFEDNSTATTKGGAVYATNGTLTVAASSFVRNTVALGSGGGGAIYASGGWMTLADSTFGGNRSASPGGAVYTDGAIGIDRSTFADNTSGGSGGAVYGGSATVGDSVFTHNVASGSGGALFQASASARATVTDTTFQGNRSGSNAGALGATAASVTWSRFAENTAGSYGGAINSGSVSVGDSVFSGNSAAYGGGISQTNTALTLGVVRSTFRGNSASSNGGAIRTEGKGTVGDSLFEENTGGITGGAIYQKNSPGALVVDGSTFNRNSPGAIYAEGGLTVRGSGFAGNVASGTGAGAIIAATPRIEGSRFDHNRLVNGIAGGGAIYATGGATVVTSDFTANTFEPAPAYTNGAGAIETRGSLLSISDSTFVDNSSGAKYGGAVSHYGSSVIVVGSTFTGNTTALIGFGGAIYTSGTVSVSGSLFERNRSGGHGGAIGSSMNDGNVTVRRSAFIDNRASYVGGALAGPAQMIVEDSTFAGNRAGTGSGAIQSGTALPLILRGSTFLDNSTASSTEAISSSGSISAGDSIFVGGTCATTTRVVVSASFAAAASGCPGTTTTRAALALGSLGDHGGPTPTIPLLPGSVAIEPTGGSAVCATATDQRSVARPQGLRCDAGAYEYERPTITTLVVDPTSGARYGEAVTLSAAVAAAQADGVPGGRVSFADDHGWSVTCTITDGTCAVATSALRVGSVITATYEGDGTFVGSRTTAASPVSRAILAVSPLDRELTTGSAIPAASFYGFTLAGWARGETTGSALDWTPPACGSDYSTGTPAGTIAITCSGGSAHDYELRYGTAILTVLPPPEVVVTVTGTTAYGGTPDYRWSQPAGTASLTGTLSGCATDATAGSPVGGGYRVLTDSCSGLTAPAGSSVRYVDGGFAVTRAAQSIAVTAAAPPTARFGATFAVAATAPAASGVAIEATGGCRIVSGGTGTATFEMTSGTRACGVTLRAAGDGNHDAATPVTATVAALPARPSCLVTGYDVTYDATSHTATGSCAGLDGAPLPGLDLTATRHRDATAGQSAWAFTHASGDYEASAGTVATSIRPRPLSATVSIPGKTYDGTTGAAIAGCSLAGVLPGDGVSCSTAGATASFSDPAVGTHGVTVSGLSLMGLRVADYLFGGTALGSAAIAPRTLRVRPDATTRQYSDPNPPFTFTLTGFAPGEDRSVIGDDAGEQLPTCTTSTAGLDRLAAPGTYSITCSGGSDGSYVFDTTTGATLTVAAEDARVTYIGGSLFWTPSATATSATVTFGASVRDITAVRDDPRTDGSGGSIAEATVRFVDRETGAALCTAAVVLLDVRDPLAGTATCTASLVSGKLGGTPYLVGMIVGGRYVRNATEDDTVVEVAQPLVSNFISGGAWLLAATSAGRYAATAGHRINLGLNVKYTKTGSSLQGSVSIVMRSGGRTYRIRTNSLTSLGISLCRTSPCPTAGAPSTATVVAQATLQDITNPAAVLSLAGGGTLQLTLRDGGGNVADDALGITFFSKEGVLLFSSAWCGTKTQEQVLAGGNLVAR